MNFTLPVDRVKIFSISLIRIYTTFMNFPGNSACIIPYENPLLSNRQKGFTLLSVGILPVI